MSHQENQQIRFSQHLLKRMELESGVIGEVGFAYDHIEACYQQFSGDVQGGDLQIVDIGLEGRRGSRCGPGPS